MQFTLTIDRQTHQKAKKAIVDQAIKKITVKGFRKGKAPRHKAEAALDQNRIIEETINQILPPAYNQYIKANDLKPITQPKITPTNIGPDSDWQFTVEIAQKPEVDLGDFHAGVKKAKPGPDIIKPGQQTPADPKEQEQQLMTAIYQALLQSAKVDIPPLLIQEESNRSLSQLLEQIDQLGLTIEQYASSIGRSVAIIRKDYQQKAETSLKLDFIIDAIAQKEKLTAGDTEYRQFLDQVTDPKVKSGIETDPYRQAMIKHALTRDRVINFLKDL